MGNRQRVAARHYSVLQALLKPRVLALSLVYFGAAGTNYGLSFFLPQIVKAFGMTNLQTGFVSGIPYVVGVISIVWWGHRSDAKLERRFHTAFAIFAAAAGLTVAAFPNDPTAKMVAFSVAGFGIFGVLPVFWTLPTWNAGLPNSAARPYGEAALPACAMPRKPALKGEGLLDPRLWSTA